MRAKVAPRPRALGGPSGGAPRAVLPPDWPPDPVDTRTVRSREHQALRASCRRPDSIRLGEGPTGKAQAFCATMERAYATPVARLTPTARHIPETSLAAQPLGLGPASRLPGALHICGHATHA